MRNAAKKSFVREIVVLHDMSKATDHYGNIVKVQHTPTHSSTLQQTPTHCNTLEHTPKHSNTLSKMTDSKTLSKLKTLQRRIVRMCDIYLNDVFESVVFPKWLTQKYY